MLGFASRHPLSRAGSTSTVDLNGSNVAGWGLKMCSKSGWAADYRPSDSKSETLTRDWRTETQAASLERESFGAKQHRGRIFCQGRWRQRELQKEKRVTHYMHDLFWPGFSIMDNVNEEIQRQTTTSNKNENRRMPLSSINLEFVTFLLFFFFLCSCL